MKKNFIAKISLVLCVLVLLSALAVLLNAAALDRPLLYYNDVTWVREDRLPIRLIGKDHYIPLTVFAQLDDTKVRINNSLGTFVISHAGLYVSFDENTGIATDQSENTFKIDTYKFDGGERYVPARAVCKYLGFGFDSYVSVLTGETAIRVTDGTEKLSFKALLEKHNPDILKTEEDTTETTSLPITSESASDTTEQTSESADIPNPPVRVLGNRIIYITFTYGVGDYTKNILDALSLYGYKATFFVSYDDILKFPTDISDILSYGHSLGACPGTDTGAYESSESFIAEADRINELLYRVYKTKTRIIRPDSAYRQNGIADTEKLTDSGYSLWNANVARADGIYDNYTATGVMTDAIWNNNTVIFDFGNNISTSYVLSNTLGFINENRGKCDVRAIAPYHSPRG